MKAFSRRDLLKSSLLAPAAVAATHPLHAVEAVARPAAGALPTADLPASSPNNALRQRLLLDFGWRFHLGHATDPALDFGYNGSFQKTGNFLRASSIAFDDSDWTPVDLPHDWAVELPFTRDPDLKNKGFYPLGRKYPATSVGWYRRVFTLDEADRGKRISIEFDGAYRESMVVFNGFYIGRHSGGYDPFRFDLTDFANPGGRNVLLVRVDASSSDGWFYEGAGIYRHLWLVKTAPVHLRQWGAFVRAEIKGSGATLRVRTEIENDTPAAAEARVVSSILDPAGKQVARDLAAPLAIPAVGQATFEQQIPLVSAHLWSLEERNLYTLVSELHLGGQVVDRTETPFGIRSIEMDPERGFLLNGKPVKIKGTCNHQDHAGLGAALPDAVQRFRIAKLIEMGSNGLRTSHNPPTPELLDACDRLGMLVFDETRMMSSNPEGLGQFENLIRRDRNHPSVFMWSMGNEESAANSARGVGILTAMKAIASRHDGSRPVSIAPTGAVGTGGLAVGDVIGYNYADPEAAAYHKEHPDRPVIGTETVSAVGTRGIYISDPDKGFVSSYDPYTTTGRASAEGWWRFCDAQPWLAGGFVWTGFDYRGEPSPNGWPNIGSQYGILDLCGFPKDTFYYYQAWWTRKPVLHIFPHWNWPGYEGKKIAVWVHSNMDRVELFLNGQSLGAKDLEKNHHLAWDVVYAPGVLEARGYKGGKLAMTERRETTGGARSLALVADRSDLRADGEDTALVRVEIRDAQNRLVPITDNLVDFELSGPARLIGVGNGDPTDQAPDKASSRKAFGGLALAILQTTQAAGAITLTARSYGLAPASLTLASSAVQLRPQVAPWERPSPKGAGATGLWRPEQTDAPRLYILEQEGEKLTGSIEGIGHGWAGGDDVPVSVEEGSIVGNKISFKVGRDRYSGTLEEDWIKLHREESQGGSHRPNPLDLADPSLAIGPAPDGADPSSMPPRHPRSVRPEPPLILRRVPR